ncbi:Glycosyltransferase, GlcNAc [Phytophthora cactorum]|nr:Glycosyltransferase, GlcNAc [Phytophthora cactorum]
MKRLQSLGLVLLLGAVGIRADDKPVINVLGTTKYLDLDPSVQHFPLDPYDKSLRHHRQDPQHFRDPHRVFGLSGRRTMRQDSVHGIEKSSLPGTSSVWDSGAIGGGDPTCLDEYCKLALDEWPDYQEMIGDEEFCLQVDGHSIFTNKWDEVMLEEWKRINNEMAILTVYPHDIHGFVKENGDNNAPDWIPHLCTTIKGGNGLTRIVGASIKRNANFPQMTALWGGGLSFSKCHAERNVPVDSHTPWLWDGEEFLRSADYWTHGYDLYSPSRIGNVLYHNYSKKPASFWESPVDPAVKALDTEMTHNRVRLRVGLGFKGPVDAYELDKYKFGTARSFQQYLKFANMSFDGWMNETNSCGQLHWWKKSWESLEDDSSGSSACTTGQKSCSRDGEMEEEVEDVVRQQAIGAHVKNGAGNGDEKPLVRHGVSSPGRRKRSNAPAWGLLAVVLAALFVALSNDSKSRAIRQSCIAKAPHLSHD